MYRFWCLEPFGATTYLSGVGSFNPKMEEDFYKNYIDNNKEYAKNIMLNYEKPLFKKFMNIGWHASMRESLRIMGYINNNREPFYTVTEEEKNIIKKALNKIL
jgi:dihydrodipicolinate synthase/N-acetylneuraminate lyase